MSSPIHTPEHTKALKLMAKGIELMRVTGELFIAAAKDLKSVETTQLKIRQANLCKEIDDMNRRYREEMVTPEYIIKGGSV